MATIRSGIKKTSNLGRCYSFGDIDSRVSPREFAIDEMDSFCFAPPTSGSAPSEKMQSHRCFEKRRVSEDIASWSKNIESDNVHVDAKATSGYHALLPGGMSFQAAVLKASQP